VGAQHLRFRVTAADEGPVEGTSSSRPRRVRSAEASLWLPPAATRTCICDRPGPRRRLVAHNRMLVWPAVTVESDPPPWPDTARGCLGPCCDDRPALLTR
jgi:hypothetical protein